MLIAEYVFREHIILNEGFYMSDKYQTINEAILKDFHGKINLNDEQKNKYYSTIKVESWDDAKKILDNIVKNGKGQWIFRGQGDAEWQLNSSIKRMYSYLNIDVSSFEDDHINLFKKIFLDEKDAFIELGLEENDYFGWLCMFQH